MKLQKTLVIIKPDAVKRGLIGDIVNRYEMKGLRIIQMKMVVPSVAQLEAHYSAHIEKPFYNALLDFMLSGTVVVLVLEGYEAVEVVRKINGATNFLDAECGSVRGLYALSVTENCVHGSDSVGSAQNEIDIWFNKN